MLILGIESSRLAPNTIKTLISNFELHHYCIKDLVADSSDQMLENFRYVSQVACLKYLDSP